MSLGARRREGIVRGGISALAAYGFAVGLVAALVGVKTIAHESLGVDAPFLFMFGATVLATWFGGRGPGLVTVVLGLLAVNYLFLPPYGSWSFTPAAGLRMLVHGAEGLLIWWLTSSMQSARQRAEAASRRVEKLYTTSVALANARTADEVAHTVVREAMAILGARAVAAYLASNGASTLRLVAEAATGPRLFEPLRELPLDGDGPIAAATRGGEPVRVGSVGQLGETCPELRVLGSADLTLMCVPFHVGDRPMGVLLFGFAGEWDLGPEARMVASALATDCARALERARLYDAERRARMEADEANRAKDEFLRVASHELRTPLTAIGGWVHLLQKTRDPKRFEHGLAVIARNVEAQTRLVEDILDVSRMVAGRLKVEAHPVELASVVRSCVDEFVQIAAARRLHLTMASTGPAVVTGDRDRLCQVTRNLVANAIKFTPSGGHVWVDVEAQGGKALLRVLDDGKGIPAEELPYVFEVFRQVDSSTTRRESGLGLGLPIVRYLAETHGGTVRIESEGPGGGTNVLVELPLRDAALERDRSRHEAEQPAAPMLSDMRVLLVEDDPDTAETIAQLLLDAGAEVRQARSAAAALETLRSFTPDVLVSDIGMPDEDGYTLLRKVRALGAVHARMPAVALTAYASADDIRASRQAGFQRHLAKPVQAEALASTLADLVDPAA